MADSDNDVAGLPFRLRASEASTPGMARTVAGRDPLEEAGVPLCGTKFSPLTTADYAGMAAECQEQAESELAASNANQKIVPGFFQVSWALLTGVLAIGGVACCLFVFSQTVQLLANLQSLSGPLRYGGYALLAVLALISCYIIGKLLVAVLWLRQNRQVSLGNLRALQSRLEFQKPAQHKQQAAKNQLRRWLEDYPLEQPVHRHFLSQCGVGGASLNAMAVARQQLLDIQELHDWDSWIHKFAVQIQERLDDAADQIVREYAKTVGVKTALSPNPLVDTVVLIYSGCGLLASLCRVYNLRVDLISMLRLAGLVFSQAYLAGRLEELPVEEWLTAAIDKALTAVGNCHLPLVGNIAGALAGPGIQGAANGMLIGRLGRHASRLLRPVATS
jgi:uncharacterized membrane protein YcjF (UPF0283 family)